MGFKILIPQLKIKSKMQISRGRGNSPPIALLLISYPTMPIDVFSRKRPAVLNLFTLSCKELRADSLLSIALDVRQDTGN